MGSPRQTTSKLEFVNERISEMESVLSDVNQDESRFAVSTENITELEKGPTDAVSRDESEVDFVLTENSPSSNQDGPELEPLELPGTTASGYSPKAKDSPEVDSFNMPPLAQATSLSSYQERPESYSSELPISIPPEYSTAAQETSKVDSSVNMPPPAEARIPPNHERFEFDSFELSASTASWYSTASQETSEVVSYVNIPPPAGSRTPPNHEGFELDSFELLASAASWYSTTSQETSEVKSDVHIPPPAEARRHSNHERLGLDSFELPASTASEYSTAAQETSEVDSSVNMPPPEEARKPPNHERLRLDSFELPASTESGYSTTAQELPDVDSNFKLSFSKEVEGTSSNQLRAGVNSFEFPASTTSELSTLAKEIPEVESYFKMPILTDVQRPSSIPRIPDTDCNTELAGLSTTRDTFFDNFKAPSEDFNDNVHADETPPPVTDNEDDSSDPHLSNSEEFLVKDNKCSGLMGCTLRFFQAWLAFSICMSDSIFLVPFQVVLLALSLSAISVGLMFRHDCPALKEIPILILTLGFMGILAIALRIIFVVYYYISHLLRYRNVQRCIITVVNFVFLIMLSYELWTFFNFTPSFIPGFEDYCNPVFHTYAFILNCIVLFLVVLLFIMHFPAFLYYQFHMDGT